jgi:hypothetical protein
VDYLFIAVGVVLVIGTVGLLIFFWTAFIALLVMTLVHLCNFKGSGLSNKERILALALLSGLLYAIYRVVTKKLL